VDIDIKGLEKTREQCKSSDLMLNLDLTKPSLFKNAILGIIPNFGKLNGFIHLAGKPYISPLKSVSEEKCAEIYSLNTYAAIELAKIFSGKNVYAGEKGSIVLISSVYGLVGSSANVGYAMSKAALHGITKSLSIELASKRVRVNCIAPGFVKTQMTENAKGMFNDDYWNLLEKMHPLGLGEPEDVAHAIIFLLSDAAKWITGAIISIDGGFTAQ
jgi:NAD(P)-dependent dehydrogenase (short-subunit alcohol dehydrogenase family)